tara:strand:+ start:353 stop:454 length:102 start_codon:yes stop_codon:yes gene_type:complete
MTMGFGMGMLLMGLIAIAIASGIAYFILNRRDK